MVTLALLLENQSCDELTDLEISSLVGAGKQPGRMSFHLVLQPSRPTVVLLPPQRIPESICNRGWSVYGSSMCTLVNISPVLPTLLLPLVQKGGGSHAGSQPAARLPSVRLGCFYCLSTSRIQRAKPGGKHRWSSDGRTTAPPDKSRGVRLHLD